MIIMNIHANVEVLKCWPTGLPMYEATLVGACVEKRQSEFRASAIMEMRNQEKPSCCHGYSRLWFSGWGVEKFSWQTYMAPLTLRPSVQSNIQATCFLLPLWTGIKGKSFTFQKQSPAAHSFWCYSLVLSFSTTQQYSAKWVNSYWCLGKGKKIK